MQGQYFAQITSDDGTTIGQGFTFLDADQVEGHVLYDGHRLDPRGMRVGRMRFENLNTASVRAIVLPYPQYEDAYKVPQGLRLGPQSRVTLDLSRVDPNTYRGTWTSHDDGTVGTVVLNRMWRTEPAAPTHTFNDWFSYKQWADNYVGAGCAFRGQVHQRLMSSFHRTGRVDLVRYLSNDLPQFADHVDTLTGRNYDLHQPEDLGAVLGLAQHHGFPTPLLDWTDSPYVAAYFAFAQVVENATPPPTVRVYRLSSHTVKEGLGRPINFASTVLATVAYRPTSRGNARLLHQQGLFTFSNVADAETMLRHVANPGDPLKIDHVEISSAVARRALADLRNMGTTAATLFPGLDGSSTFLKHLLFFGP